MRIQSNRRCRCCRCRCFLIVCLHWQPAWLHRCAFVPSYSILVCVPFEIKRNKNGLHTSVKRSRQPKYQAHKLYNNIFVYTLFMCINRMQLSINDPGNQTPATKCWLDFCAFRREILFILYFMRPHRAIRKDRETEKMERILKCRLLNIYKCNYTPLYSRNFNYFILGINTSLCCFAN